MFADLRGSVRLLRSSPGMTTVAIVSLALGAGASATVYSVIHGVTMRAYAFEEPNRLVVLWESHAGSSARQEDPRVTSALEWRRANRCFTGLEMLTGGQHITVTGPGIAERLQGQFTTPDLFSLLGVHPELGRTYVLPQDASTVILSHNYWRRRFEGRTDAVGQILTIEGEARTVIGVMPPRFQRFFTDGDADIWLPIDFSQSPWRERQGNIITLARLQPGETYARAEAEMNAIEQGIDPHWRILLKSLPDAIMEIWKPDLYPLFGMVSVVLLIACVYVANLLLARAALRRKELAVRTALGASRARMIGQLLCDGLLLALPGGVVGVLVTYWGVDMWAAFSPPWFPEAREITPDRAVLFFIAAAAVLSGTLMGLIPAIHGSRINLNESLKGNGRGAGPTRQRLRSMLAIAEVALSLILTVSAGLMIRTFQVQNPSDRGFRSENILTMRLDLPDQRYGGAAASEFYRQLLERFPKITGVESAAIATGLPTGGGGAEIRFTIAGAPEPELANDRPHAIYTAVSPELFRTLDIPLRRGRGFTAHDREGSPPVAVITEALARRYFRDRDPIGRLLLLDNLGEPREIVGVAGDVRNSLARPPQPALYLAFAQQPAPMGDHMTLAIRAAGKPELLAGTVPAAVRQIDAAVPVFDIRPMRDLLARPALRFFLWQFGMLAAIAIALSVIGIHGVMSWTVNDRLHEIGIRMAVGAGPAEMRRMIAGRVVRLAVAGIAIGIVGAWLACRLLYDFLVGVKPTDPATYVAVSAFMLVIALGSSWAPAREAARVDPMVALRKAE